MRLRKKHHHGGTENTENKPRTKLRALCASVVKNPLERMNL
jgi:hypothetical protein